MDRGQEGTGHDEKPKLTADPGYWGRSGRIVRLDSRVQHHSATLQLCSVGPFRFGLLNILSQTLDVERQIFQHGNTVRGINPERTGPDQYPFTAPHRTARPRQGGRSRFHQFTFTSPCPFPSVLHQAKTTRQTINNTYSHFHLVFTVTFAVAIARSGSRYSKAPDPAAPPRRWRPQRVVLPSTCTYRHCLIIPTPTLPPAHPPTRKAQQRQHRPSTRSLSTL